MNKIKLLSLTVMYIAFFVSYTEDSDGYDAHKKFSVQCFNDCWKYIAKPNRSKSDNEMMVALAYSSYFHWKSRSDVSLKNVSISYWQLSRVYTLIDDYKQSIYYARRCRDVSKKGNLSSFYKAYAYEAMARAEITQKNYSKARELLSAMNSQMNNVKDAFEINLLKDDYHDLKSKLKN